MSDHHDGRPAGLTWNYDRTELVADGIVHVVGSVAALFAAFLLIDLALRSAPLSIVAAVTIYAVTLVAGLAISAVYNIWPVSRTKWLLRRFDHAAIYGLIAGTYTPFLVHLGTKAGYIMLAVVWVIALAGAALKLAKPGRFDRLSIALYLGLGWSGLVVAQDMYHVLSTTAALLLAGGGLVSSIGVVFHVWENLRFQNAIWHSFVLVAAGCQYGAVLGGVLPS
ncbi:MAG: hemolysin III family protein [Alphaproteobacteria bacterium]